MTDTIRDLLISLSSHMAYMQGQLEACHELHNPENAYWYRKSVALRQKVTDALADEPAVPALPADGEAAKLVARMLDMQTVPTLEERRLAAELLQRQALVPEVK